MKSRSICRRISRNMTRLRERKSLSKTKLAKIVRADRGKIARMEKSGDIGTGEVECIASALGVSAKDLMFKEF